MYWISEGRRKAQRFMCDRCKEVVYDNAHGACRYPVCPFCGVSKKGTRMRIEEYPYYVDIAKIQR